MKHFKSILILLFILVVVSPVYCTARGTGQNDAVVIAMCRPSESQIKNIEQLYERDIITLNRIILIGVYHEDETTDYEAAKAYVKENELYWVTFEMVTGKVDIKDLFKKNAWTGQFKAIFDKTDAIIFTGGSDIPPAVYGEDNNLLTDADTPIRCLYEVSFFFHLIGGSQNPGFTPFLESRTGYPVLGICLGSQTMNVAAGGTLYQDIPSQAYGFKTVQDVLKAGREKIHSSRYIRALYPLEEDLPPAFHRIKFKKGSSFIKRLKMKETGTPYILTSHHQGMKDLGKDLKTAATSMDGKIVEILEHRNFKNVVGVQFHPEYYPLYMKGRFYKEKPGAPLDFNLRSFLNGHPPSMSFHKAIWQWFSQAAGNEK
jgi:putative glutamine amidotransferase